MEGIYNIHTSVSLIKRNINHLHTERDILKEGIFHLSMAIR